MQGVPELVRRLPNFSALVALSWAAAFSAAMRSLTDTMLGVSPGPAADLIIPDDNVWVEEGAIFGVRRELSVWHSSGPLAAQRLGITCAAEVTICTRSG